MNPLPRLREIRDELRHCEGLRRERNRLIRESELSQRQLARTAGLSRTQIQRIQGET